MKKRFAALLLLALLCAAICAPASAEVRATPIDKLAFRTGPNTRYVELFTLPKSTKITAIERAEGNGVTWVLVEFYCDGSYQRAYTGLKRMKLHGEIPWESDYHSNAIVSGPCTVRAAPRSNAARRGKIGELELVTRLGSENGYDYVEFYDAANEALSRGWIKTDGLGDTDGDGAFMRKASRVYRQPSSKSGTKGKVGKFEVVGYLSTRNGYDHILFYSASEHSISDGYVPSGSVSVYH